MSRDDIEIPLAGSLSKAASKLSKTHRLRPGPPGPIAVWERIGSMGGWLRRARAACVDAPPDVEKAAEWLLDNDYHVHRAIRQIDGDLPPAFYARLEALDEAGNPPRIFALAHGLLHASRLQVSLPSAIAFVSAYQKRAALTTAELWAFPTMLRLACLEIVASAFERLIPALKAPFEPSSFASAEDSFDETERVARGIANLGLISAIPWQQFFERVSSVEEALRDDPSAHYPKMDFATRDRYRSVVERLAREVGSDEAAVASTAVAMASSSSGARGHVGYWLIGDGRIALEKALGFRPPARLVLGRYLLKHASVLYVAAIAGVCVAALILPALYLRAVAATPLAWALCMLATIVPASILATTLVHWLVTLATEPRVLPKLDFAKGIPADCRTLVAVPVLIRGPDEVPGLVEQLECHRLANPDRSLQFALLSDFADAPTEHWAEDEAIEKALAAGVAELNRRHGRRGRGPFHFLHRHRVRNPSEGCWMGWERKRGKLEQLNRLLLGEPGSGFAIHVGDPEALEGIRFVVTADADTRLPRGSVARLVGTLAHPLNTARLHPRGSRIASGYSVIQPRVEISPESGNRSTFSRLFTGDTAIDIYSRAVSDVYQDLFGEGIFVGKGIYEVAAFHRSVDGHVPENAILSHDLFEGILGRAGLATDIVLYEKFPGTYFEYLRRWHRWIRGDWQLLPWLFPTVPASRGRRRRNLLSPIDRWKVLDNLRRSLVAPSLVAFAAAGWLLLPGTPWFWTLLALLAPAGHLFTDLVSGLARGRRRGSIHGVFAQLWDQSGRWFLALVFLPREAATALHAIGTALWRMGVSRRGLLEWTSAAHVAQSFSDTPGRFAFWRFMWQGPVSAAALAGLVGVANPAALAAAAPLLALWLASPEIAYRIGRPRRLTPEPLGAADERFLRKLARRTWLYFETFAGPEDNWLPPDNYQEEPFEEIAHRTSPTNVGMMLLSCLTARDLGYVGTAEFAARIEAALDSLDRLERYRGHFLNWYDTRTLVPLEPRYVSTVDSGNLAFCLLALAAGCDEARDDPAADARRWAGLLDTCLVLGDVVARPALRDAEGLAERVDQLKRCIEDSDWESPGGPGALEDLEQILLPDLERHFAGLSASDKPAPLEDLRAASIWLERLRHQARSLMRDTASADPGVLDGQLADISRRARAIAFEMDFRPVYDRERRLFHIGYNVGSDRLDMHHYDLLATEARLASYFAIAKGDVPAEHWFFLGRPVTREREGLTLLSWNGSMFEYLMAPLFLRSGPETLLAESERTAVAMQRRHGERHDIPWGVSESAFADRDPHHRYRYQAFGVPGLGLKRGLEKDLVVAPYASALALAVEPAAAAANLRELWRLGAGGLYGLFEAADFTPERLERGESFTPVRAYMAHHQGMIMSAIGNALCADSLVRRVAADGRMRVVDLLLSERIPREIPSEIERIAPRQAERRIQPSARAPYAWPAPSAAAFPQVHMLGNGRMACWISEAGGGALQWRHHALTRFRADSTCDDHGLWIYVSDEADGALWSAARQPTQAPAQEYQVTFHPHLAEFHRRDRDLSLRTEVAVTHADDVEIRRVTIINESPEHRIVRLTSYGEVVLAPPLDDERHPAFSKLFVGGTWLPGLGGLLFQRRPRNPRDAPPALLHRVIADEKGVELSGHEGDRRAFLGRNGSPGAPEALRTGLTGTTGWTLDPVMALQARIEIAPRETREVCFLTIAAGSAEAVLEVADRYATMASIEWALDDAATAAAGETQRLGIDPDRLPDLQRLASLLVHPHPALRAEPELLRRNRGGQPLLWGLGVSGDHPILLVRTGAGAEGGLDLLRDLVLAHRLWLRRGLAVDLVLLSTAASGYLEPARDELLELLQTHGAHEYLGRRGGIHLAAADQVGGEIETALEAAASVVLDERRGPLAQQLAAARPAAREIPRFDLVPMTAEPGPTEPLTRPADLLFDNGFGGFSADGRDYVIHLAPGEHTPAPWSNVLANDGFGSVVTESGGGFAWAGNSGENRLTPWSNDPVADRPGDMLYLRDEETGEVWTPSPFAAGGAACQVRHGAGFTRWLQRSRGLDQELLAFVPVDDPVKILRLRLHNFRDAPRRITATFYADWLLGAMGSAAKASVVCEYDPACRAILARNPRNPDFGDRVAFVSSSRPPHGVCGDRHEFIGREGDLRSPAALRRWGLSSNVAAGPDSCAAYQVHLDVAPGEAVEVVFTLGQGRDRAEAEGLVRKWQDPALAKQAFADLERHWDRILGAVRVRTPDPAFDLLVNRWLLYQTLASRVLARAGFYQAGGAIGFRDQLQDMLALVLVEPERVRAHLLDCCAHQFEEGDVLHWWHPPQSRGVRTRCSDDLLWLPYAVARYVEATGDLALLDEAVSFLRAPPLAADEEDRFARFDSADQTHTVWEHCVRAVAKGVTAGANGLPLIGSGDWNDGMDRVGRAGRGESVWLAWFAIVTLERLARLAERIGRNELAAEWVETAARLKGAAEENGWDGAWYRRAFDDDGEPFGSAANDECRIDSISQSWSAFAGADPARVGQALAAASRELVDEGGRLVRLLHPPFDRTPRDPGYIKAYPPGVRENGGQYTHAAAWLGLAHAARGDGDAAFHFFDLLNPLRRAADREGAEHYRVEPYVAAADIADGGALAGRGGWTWYTGSSAWLWRLAVEGILGLRIETDSVHIAPCLPKVWGGYEVELTGREESLVIRVRDPDKLGSGAVALVVDGAAKDGNAVVRPTGGHKVDVEVTLLAAS